MIPKYTSIDVCKHGAACRRHRNLQLGAQNGQQVHDADGASNRQRMHDWLPDHHGAGASACPFNNRQGPAPSSVDGSRLTLLPPGQYAVGDGSPSGD